MDSLKFIAEPVRALLKSLGFFPGILDLSLQVIPAAALVFLIASQSQFPAVELGFSERDLFHHGGSSLAPGLNIRTLIQNADDLLFAFIYPGCDLRYLL